jgi:hypothetical protein
MMSGPDRIKGIINAGITGSLLVCVIVVLVGSFLRWVELIRTPVPEPA